MQRDRRLAIIYQRPIDDKFSGGSAHLRGFVQELERYISVSVVAPRMATIDRKRPDSLLTSIRNIIWSNLGAGRFIVNEARLPPRRRAAAVLLFDIYAAFIPFLWARVTSKPVVYYAQDLGDAVLRAFRLQGYRGTVLLRALRLPLERLLLANSDLILTVSEDMTKVLASGRPPPGRILTFPIKRTRPVIDEQAIAAWRTRLETSRRVGIVFIGNLNYPPNRSAAAFIQATLREACARLDDKAVFVLVGKGTEHYAVDSIPCIVGLGPVDDLSSLLYACHIGIAPLSVPGGISGKLVDYLIHGLRVVATPEAVSGIAKSEDVVVTSLDSFGRTLASVVETIDPHSSRTSYAVPGPVEQRYLIGLDVGLLCSEIDRLL